MRIKVFFIVFFAILSINAMAQMTISCTNCNGVGSFKCRTCGGAGVVLGLGLYAPQWVRCGFCNGTGTSICPLCGGGGKVTLNISNNGNYSSNGNGTNNNSNSSSSSSNNNNSSSSSSQHWCGVCKGTGSMTKSWYLGSDYETYCNICKKKFYHGHSHVTCTSCNGKGYW